MSPFSGNGRILPFVHLAIVFWFYTELHYRGSRSSNFLVFHTSGGISWKPVDFLFLVLVSAMSSSSCVNYPSLISHNFRDRFISYFRGFPSKVLKCSSHMCIHSSWLVAFSLALGMFFLILTSFTACHAIRNCLSSSEFLIFLIWFWMYSICSFRYALVSSLCAFLSFWALVLVLFL